MSPIKRRPTFAAGGLMLLSAMGLRHAAAQSLMSQEKAAYQGTPKGLQMCGTCNLFIRPHSCKVVDGLVDRSGWCKLYDLAD